MKKHRILHCFLGLGAHLIVNGNVNMIANDSWQVQEKTLFGWKTIAVSPTKKGAQIYLGQKLTIKHPQ